MLYIFKAERAFTPENMKEARQELLEQITEGLVLLHPGISFVGIALEMSKKEKAVVLTGKEAAQHITPDTAENWIERELSVENYNQFVKILIAENDHDHPTYEEWRRELEPDAITEAEEMKAKGAFV